MEVLRKKLVLIGKGLKAKENPYQQIRKQYCTIAPKNIDMPHQ